MSDASSISLQGALLGGRYRVGRLLGAGGMGAVYEAMQEDLGRRVAIKVLLPEVIASSDDAEALRRFAREARAAAALHHPNIVAVTDFSPGDATAPAFLVMELLQGRSVARAIMDEGRLGPERVVTIAIQILAALETAHAAGLVHRDIKPDNVFLVPVTGAAGGELVKVLDFGIAKLARGGGATSSGLTATGAVLGTPAYMSPEQARGRDVDARSDLYAVGALMYHALSGR
ncbi:MAG: serine/threonine-protein kinase, partial [Polyangiales bacterium]